MCGGWRGFSAAPCPLPTRQLTSHNTQHTTSRSGPDFCRRVLGSRARHVQIGGIPHRTAEGELGYEDFIPRPRVNPNVMMSVIAAHPGLQRVHTASSALTQSMGHSLDGGDRRDCHVDTGMETCLTNACTTTVSNEETHSEPCAAAPEGRPSRDLEPADEGSRDLPPPGRCEASIQYSFHRVNAHGTGSILQQPLSDAALNANGSLHHPFNGDGARVASIAHFSPAQAPMEQAPKPLHAHNVPGPRARLAQNTLPPGANPRCTPPPMALEAIMGYLCKTLELDAVDFWSTQDQPRFDGAGGLGIGDGPTPGPQHIPPFRTQSYAPGGSHAIDELDWCRITLVPPLINKVISTHQPVWFGRAAQQQQALQHSNARGLNVLGVPCPCSTSEMHAAGAAAEAPASNPICAVLLLYASRPIIRTAPLRRLLRVLGETVMALVDVSTRLGPAPPSTSFALHPHAAESSAAGWLLLLASRTLHADVSEQWMAREVEAGRVELSADRILVGARATPEGITTATGPCSELHHPISVPMCHAAFLADTPFWHDNALRAAAPGGGGDGAATGHGDVFSAMSLTMLRCASARGVDGSAPHQACIFVLYSRRRVEELMPASVLLTRLQELLECAMAVAHARAVLHAAVAALPKHEVHGYPPQEPMRTAPGGAVPGLVDEDETLYACGRDCARFDPNKLGCGDGGIRKSRRSRRASWKVAGFPPVQNLRDAQFQWMREAAAVQKQRRSDLNSSDAPGCERSSAQKSRHAPPGRLPQADSLPLSTTSSGLAPVSGSSTNDAYMSSPIWSNAQCSEDSEQEDAFDRLLDSCLGEIGPNTTSDSAHTESTLLPSPTGQEPWTAAAPSEHGHHYSWLAAE